MKGTLRKLSHNANALRTDAVVGDTYKLPTVGECFLLYAAPLEQSRGFRYVRTSVVQRVYDDGRFDTMNSSYQFEPEAT